MDSYFPRLDPGSDDPIADLLTRLKSARSDNQRLRNHVAAFDCQVQEFEREYRALSRALSEMRRATAEGSAERRNGSASPQSAHMNEQAGPVRPDGQRGRRDEALGGQLNSRPGEASWQLRRPPALG